MPSDPDLTPATILDALRDHPEWDDRRRDEELDRLVAQFDADRLLEAARNRIGVLGLGDGEAVLRLIEAFGERRDLEALAEALARQTDLPPERAWEVLELLEGSGLIERDPGLLERRDDIEEVIDDEADVLTILATQLEESEEGPWLALQGFGSIEADVRSEILDGLVSRPAGPGMVEFLRLLAFAFEPRTRAAALSGLKSLPIETPGLKPAWAALAIDHPDREVRTFANRSAGTLASNLPSRSPPRIVRSLVSRIDGDGLGLVAILAEERGNWVSSAFACDVGNGITEVVGRFGVDPIEVGSLLDDLAGEPGREAVEGAGDLARSLLAACLSVSGPAAPPALRYWLERTVGTSLRPRPLASCLPPTDGRPADDVPPSIAAAAILDACPDWVDDSDLTYEIADELRLRNRAQAPDPSRDSGAFRFLFEHRLHARLGRIAAMLAWMAGFWHARGQGGLAQAAADFARQLADPQHAVPAHPFVAALASRSLIAAQADLGRGIDLRHPAARTRPNRGS